MHTDGVHAKVVTCETVELREFTAMKRANVEKILSTLPYFFLKSAPFHEETRTVGVEVTN